MKLQVLVLHHNIKLSGIAYEKCKPYIAELHAVNTLEQALVRLKQFHYSIVVVEVTHPWRFANEPLIKLRAATDTPILALLRGRNIDDFRRCRETANDCVWEPFDPDEIIARGTALVEHGVFNNLPTSAIKHIYCRGLLILPKYRRVYVKEQEVSLARKEYNILLFMARHREQVLSKEQIYTNVWQDDYIENIDGVVSYHIHSLRKKLADFSQEEYIENVWGEGYRFCEWKPANLSNCI